MSLAPRLDLRQTQSLVMTPQLQQAIKLLALSNLELEGVIAEEIEKNPLLGLDSGDADPVPPDPAPDPIEGGEEITADRLVEHGDAAADAPLDVDYDAETFHHDSPSDMAGGGLGMDHLAGPASDEGPDLDALAGDAPSLADHLLAQAGERLGGADLALARQIIDAIDEAGYVTPDALAEVAERLGLPLAEIERVLTIIQGFDPTGVGARALGECLALQAKEADRYDPCMAVLLANLDMLARGQLAPLRRMCGVDEEDFADMVRELRGYDPKPGLRFGGERMAPVTPDVFVARTRSGWSIELNSGTLPRLLVDRRYHSQLAAGSDRAGKAWLADCLANANWLVKALDQRARTIVKVASEVVKQQEAFFQQGVAHLKPLTLRAVADAIGMHESTVSRVTSNKYLSCERGLFELKYFFTSGISNTEGEGVSAEAVKSHIAKLIADEGQDILSDDKLVEILNARGFNLARRTVAKYREAIGLGSSVQRRRQKALG
jgi:RNA polymerase sigma-54 factor